MKSRDAVQSSFGPFAMIPVQVLERCKDANAIHVYAVLARYANRERRAWPGQERIAREMGASLRTVQRGLEALRAAGAVTTEPRREGGVIVGTLYILAGNSYAPPVASRTQPVGLAGAEDHKAGRQTYPPKSPAHNK